MQKMFVKKQEFLHFFNAKIYKLTQVYKLHKKTTKKLAKIAEEYGIFTRKNSKWSDLFSQEENGCVCIFFLLEF
jgi:hypothetical protein